MTGTDIIATFISILGTILIFAIIIRALLSWFQPAQGSGLTRVLDDVTEPILAPIRRMLPPVGGMDFSPILALILIYVVRYVLISVL